MGIGFPNSSMMMNSNMINMYTALMANAMKSQQDTMKAQKALLEKMQASQKQQAQIQQAQILENLELQEQQENQAALQATTKEVQQEKNADKKIGFGGWLKNLGKGAWKTIKGFVCDENGKFSLKRTLTTVAVAAAGTALCIVTGGAAAPFLVGAGAIMAGTHITKGAIGVASAKTRAEKEAAIQQIGGGALELGLAFVPAKGALKVSGGKLPKATGIKGSFQAGKECVVQTVTGAYKVGRHPRVALRNARDYYKSGQIKTNWNNAMKPANAKANLKETSKNERVQSDLAPEANNSRLKQTQTEIDNLKAQNQRTEESLLRSNADDYQAEAFNRPVLKETELQNKYNAISQDKSTAYARKNQISDLETKLENTKFKNVKEQYQTRQDLKTAQRYQKIEKHLENIKKAEEYNKPIKNDIEAIQNRLAKLDKTKNAAEIERLEARLESQQAKAKKFDRIIKHAKNELLKENAVSSFSKHKGHVLYNTMTNHADLAQEPEYETVQVSAENQAQILEQLKQYQEARREQVLKATSSQTQNTMNPFLMAQMMGMGNMGGGIDSLSLYQSPFPPII